MSRYRSRKFILALLAIVLATLLLIAGLLGSDEWVKVVGSAMLFYKVGNVAQKYIEAKEKS